MADERALKMAKGTDERARAMLSLSRTLSAQGLLAEAARMAMEAEGIAVLARTQDQIRTWRADLGEQLGSPSPSPAIGDVRAD